ncbi:thioredoxin domain-containing protein, partial [bacterium]|nr:thioredoxin domain-containing protein [bacterium]
MPNSLALAKSPYLRQHANNPVGWLEWGEAAFARARAEDKPILLSIGYSTCHWCHVMARESFENAAIAAQLNHDFIPVKLDREERPDVDRVYMTYVQARTGSGGWPLNVFLTPDLKPFFGGTYFPPEDRQGRRGFPSLLAAIAGAWHDKRADLVAEADRVLASLRDHYRNRAASVADSGGPGSTPASSTSPSSAAPIPLHEAAGDAFERGFAHLYESFDATHGGFGGAPKFPRSGNIDFLLRVAALQGGGATETGREALRLIAETLRNMIQGGLHDHLGGGFHRYSVDAGWFVPHFEKMLYDQALIARNLLDTARATGDERLAWAARGVFDYLLRDLAHPRGAFFSAEDADSDRTPAEGGGHAEGAFYVWTRTELDRVLPPVDTALVCAHFGIEDAGNVPAELDPHCEFTGRNILRQSRPLAETAVGLGLDPIAAADRLAASLERLRAIRASRPRPHLDDKVLAAWNGLALSALARAAVHPAACLADKRPFYLEAALRCARFIESELWVPARRVLLRSWRDGPAAIDGFAEDYACVVAGLLDLHQATLDPHWLRFAEKLQAALDARFWDEAEGGYFSAPADTELVLRLKDDYDGAEPAASSFALSNLVRLSILQGEPASNETAPALAPHRARAARVAEAFRSQWSGAPHALPVLLCGLADLLAEPAHVI